MGVLDFFRLQPAPVPLRDAPTPAKALSDAAVPVERSWVYNWAWQDSPGGIPLVGGLTASYAAMYERQPWVYIAVNKLARGIARLPLKVYTGGEGDERERDRTSPLARLLARPYPGGTPFGLKSALVGDLAVYGNAIAIKEGAGPRGDRVPRALYPVCPRGWSIDRDGDYLYRHPETGKETPYRREQILHIAYWRPGTGMMGLSPLEPLRMTLAIEDAAQRLGVATFGNGARPSSVLRTDQDLPREKIAELREGVARMYKGIDKAGLPAILTNGLDWKAMAWDMEQAAVVDFRKLTREEVAAAYDIPPVLLGILDRATFSNVEELHLAFYQDTLGPWTTLIEETLYEQLIAPVPEFAADARFAEFDLNAVLRGAIAQRYDALNKATGGPWMKVNEARRLENLPAAAQEEAELIRFPLNMSSNPASEEGGSNAGA